MRWPARSHCSAHAVVAHVSPAHPICVVWDSSLGNSWPRQNVDVASGQMVSSGESRMRTRIVLLECSWALSLQKRDRPCSKNLVYVASGIHVSTNDNESCFTPSHNPSPDNFATTCVSFTFTAIHSLPAVGVDEIEARLVAEQYGIPVTSTPMTVTPRPLQSGTAVTIRQNTASSWRLRRLCIIARTRGIGVP